MDTHIKEIKTIYAKYVENDDYFFKAAYTYIIILKKTQNTKTNEKRTNIKTYRVEM